jgi:hypothetical protein
LEATLRNILAGYTPRALGARGGELVETVGAGSLFNYSEPGTTASDIGQGSGPYAAALATELVKPGQSDLIMFHNMRVAVVDKTKGDQVPWTEDGIQRRQRVLFGGEAKAPQDYKEHQSWADGNMKFRAVRRAAAR